ncbi:nicotinamide riboside transporter PnuC [Chitinophaga sp.]|uniref:nicotinamide riboside transporter PnuC n=1 Tax=Chitinophaga sp. TaxID=1869181 RepID=UPI0031DA1EFB
MQQLLQGITAGLQQMTWVDVTAVFFGVLSVLCSRQNSVWVYPTGIISTGLIVYAYLQPSVGLYGEAALNVYYFVMSVYGWYHWTHKDRRNQEVEISRVNRRELGIATGIALAGWGIIYLVLHRFSDSNVPVLDAFVSSTAWSGMWLLAKRKLENWIFLNISNFVAVPLLFYKAQPLYAFLTIFLFIVAVNGYFHWLKLYRLQPNEKH